jgi:hypothetical protein
MKAILTALILFSSLQANAACFTFLGHRPSRVGLVEFRDANGNQYQASQLCTFIVNGFNSYESVRFSDQEGDLMQVAVEMSRARGLMLLWQFKGLSGNAVGENLTSNEAASIQGEIEIQPNARSGKFTDHYNGVTYQIAPASR